MPELFSQKLSAMVRARLLFRREIDIDAAGRKIFDQDFLLELKNMKTQNDHELKVILKVLVSAVFISAFIVSGQHVGLAILGQKIQDLSSILDIVLLVAGFALVMCSFTFMNSQAYDALIDQVVNQRSEEGLTDAEVLKAGLMREWLICEDNEGKFQLR